MYLANGDAGLLKKCNVIWNDISNSMTEKFSSKPIYNKKYLKIKSSYGNNIADFHGKEVPKAISNHTCLAVIIIDFILKKDENYYSQAFLK